MRSIESFWGMVLNWFTRDTAHDHRRALEQRNSALDRRRADDGGEKQRKEQPFLQSDAETLSSSQERDLDALAGLVSGLHTQARLVGQTLDEHVERLERVGGQVQDAHDRSQHLTRRAITHQS